MPIEKRLKCDLTGCEARSPFVDEGEHFDVLKDGWRVLTVTDAHTKQLRSLCLCPAHRNMLPPFGEDLI